MNLINGCSAHGVHKVATHKIPEVTQVDWSQSFEMAAESYGVA